MEEGGKPRPVGRQGVLSLMRRRLYKLAAWLYAGACHLAWRLCGFLLLPHAVAVDAVCDAFLSRCLWPPIRHFIDHHRCEFAVCCACCSVCCLLIHIAHPNRVGLCVCKHIMRTGVDTGTSTLSLLELSLPSVFFVWFDAICFSWSTVWILFGQSCLVFSRNFQWLAPFVCAGSCLLGLLKR
jgi:hypothetical protein